MRALLGTSRTISLLLAVVGAASISDGAWAQCPRWLSPFARPQPDGDVNTLVTFDDGTGNALYAGGDFSDIGAAVSCSVARWSGGAWSRAGDGLLNQGVNTLAVYSSGGVARLYAGIDEAGLAVWNGSAWLIAGPLYIDGEVRALTVFDDGNGPALFVGGFFNLVGGQAAESVARWNGTTLSPLPSGVTTGGGQPGIVRAFAVFDDGSGPALYATGSFGSAGGSLASNIARWNGTAWSAVGSGLSGFGAALQVHDDGSGPELFAGGNFQVAGGFSASHIARWNGVSWAAVGSGTNTPVLALRSFPQAGGPALYAGGGFTLAGGNSAQRIASWNGTAWSAVGAGFDGVVSTLGSFDDGSGPKLFAAGPFHASGANITHRIASWDGSAWTSPFPGCQGLTGSVYDLLVHDDGTGRAVYVAGLFQNVGLQPIRHLARWSPSGWSAVGGDLDRVADVLAVYDDGGGPELYVGGAWSTVGGVPMPGIARWDGANLQPLGAGIVDNVAALAVFDDGSGPELYASGSFTLAGGAPAANIASWNGTSWSPLGSGLVLGGPSVSVAEALAVHDDGTGPALYVGGQIVQAGGVPVANVARWNGTSWSAVGAGLPGTRVVALASYDDGGGPRLWAGTTQGVSRWNGSTWSSVGTVFVGGVFTFVVHDDGSGPAFYAGGSFFSLGGGPAFLARWTGSGWASAGAAPDYSVLALRSVDDGIGVGAELYAGGLFDSAGGIGSGAIGIRAGCGPHGVPFCSGDGSGSACPCGSAGSAGNGCPNAINAAGALLAATGIPSVTSDDVVLRGSGMRNASALYLQGTDRDSGGAGTPLYDGLRCVGGTILRLAAKTNVGGASRFPEAADTPLATRGHVPAVGGTYHYQIFYRDAATAFCPPGTANWTNGLTLVWVP